MTTRRRHKHVDPGNQIRFPRLVSNGSLTAPMLLLAMSNLRMRPAGSGCGESGGLLALQIAALKSPHFSTASTSAIALQNIEVFVTT